MIQLTQRSWPRAEKQMWLNQQPHKYFFLQVWCLAEKTIKQSPLWSASACVVTLYHASSEKQVLFHLFSLSLSFFSFSHTHSLSSPSLSFSETLVHTCACTHQTLSHALSLTHCNHFLLTYSRAQEYTHTLYTHTHTQMHTCSHTHTRNCTHAHSHTLWHACNVHSKQWCLQPKQHNCSLPDEDLSVVLSEKVRRSPTCQLETWTFFPFVAQLLWQFETFIASNNFHQDCR